MKIIYQGVFLNKESIEKLRLFSTEQGNSLGENVKDVHVTFAFKPVSPFPDALLNTSAELKIIGYGNDGQNEGFQVEIPPCHKNLYQGAETPHITFSVAPGAKPVNTKNIRFKRLEVPFFVTGKFALYTTTGIYPTT